MNALKESLDAAMGGAQRASLQKQKRLREAGYLTLVTGVGRGIQMAAIGLLLILENFCI